MQSLGILVLTASLAAGVALIIGKRFVWQRLSPTFGFATLFLIFVILTGAFYIVSMWILFEHPAEIAKKLPTTSHELHRKKKAFFDSLPK